MNIPDPWTDDDLRFLVAHYNHDMSAAMIGKHLKRTRNSIIGMANRCGMTLPDSAWADGADPITPTAREAA